MFYKDLCLNMVFHFNDRSPNYQLININFIVNVMICIIKCDISELSFLQRCRGNKNSTTVIKTGRISIEEILGVVYVIHNFGNSHFKEKNWTIYSFISNVLSWPGWLWLSSISCLLPFFTTLLSIHTHFTRYQLFSFASLAFNIPCQC